MSVSWALAVGVAATPSLDGVAAAADVPAAIVGPQMGVRDDRQVVWIPRSHLGQAPQEFLDPCSFDPDGAVIYVNEEQIARLEVPFERRGSLADYVRRFRPHKTMATAGVPSIAALLGEPVRPVNPQRPMVTAEGTPALEFDRYHSPQEGVDFFRALAASSPHIARIVGVGRSLEGREMIALRITDAPDAIERGEEKIFFCALHHAREWATHEVVLYMAQQLVGGYGRDPRITRIIDRSVVWILLNANPDGFEYSWQYDRFWRKNRRPNRDGSFGVDLNRNYAYRWGWNDDGSSPYAGSETFRGLAAASEPETQAIQAFLARERPAIAVTYHTYSQLVLFPWGYMFATPPQAYTSMRATAEQYAACVRHVHGMGYIPGQLNYTIYPINGDMTDYAYGELGVLAFTPELRPASSELGGFVLPEEEILPNNVENFAAALWLMDNVADASFTAVPLKETVSAANPWFSLSATPVNQKPEYGLGMSAPAAYLLSTWFDDMIHTFAGPGSYPANFEGTGAGSPYSLNYRPASESWLNSFTGYKSLPYIFDGGAAVPLEAYQPRRIYVGIPAGRPVRMSDLRVFKRYLSPTGMDFGVWEVVQESRTALQDMRYASPWISWDWEYAAADGSIRRAHPEGRNGADSVLNPHHTYSFLCRVRSYQFAGTSPQQAVYFLLFPPPRTGDADDNGRVEAGDYAVFAGCFQGPDSGSESEEPCGRVDFNQDGAVDLRDLADFQNRYGSVTRCPAP